jgi:hypothetical protein
MEKIYISMSLWLVIGDSCNYPCLRSNSRMNETSASMPSSGNAL